MRICGTSPVEDGAGSVEVDRRCQYIVDRCSGIARVSPPLLDRLTLLRKTHAVRTSIVRVHALASVVSTTPSQISGRAYMMTTDSPRIAGLSVRLL